MSRSSKNDDDFSSNGKTTWSLKNKTYDPAVLKELEMEVIDDKDLKPSTSSAPASSTVPVVLQSSDGKENLEPSKPVAKKARELEESGFCVVRAVPDRPLSKIRYMDKFSDELILMIFEWLSKNDLACCARVCRRWRELAYDESLWTYADLGNKRIESGLANHLLSLGESKSMYVCVLCLCYV